VLPNGAATRQYWLTMITVTDRPTDVGRGDDDISVRPDPCAKV